jgi:tetratricopeptide (TPR) repeat protein
LKKLLFYCRYFLILCLLPAIGSSCSVERNNPLSKSYHNILAHYNGYFLAREKMKEIETTIRKNHIDNYNRVLEVFPIIAPSTRSSITPQLEEVIKKASIPIQRHKNSKWVDDSYILIGKSRFYKDELDEAIATFKYVNKISKDSDARHLALVWLMRCFMQTEEYTNVVAVDDVLKKERLSPSNHREWRLARAHYFVRQKDLLKMEENVGFAIPHVIGREKRARLYYIIGQLRQIREDESGAYASYKSVLINNPSYELSFYTKLNLAQVTELSAANDVKKIHRYFRKLLRDPKNKEYQDKIYYEMARFELKQDNTGKGVELLKKSVAASGSNPNQKAFSYLKLGEVHYEKLKQFEPAKNYYDSTLMFLDKQSENYKAVQQRQKVLEEFVKHITVVQRQDSLQRLAKMDEATLSAFLDKMIADEEAQLKKAQKEQEKGDGSQGTFFDNQGGGFAVSNEAGSNWYFYNPAAISRGKAEFTRKWGNRPLEDNWRRSKKEKGGSFQEAAGEETASTAQAEGAAAGGEATATVTTDGKIDAEARKTELMKNIPFTAEQMAASHEQLSEALYQLGKVYDQLLEEPINASHTFERLLKEYPANDHRPEVMYFLYLIYKQQNDNKMQVYKNRLLNEYPTSIYARKISNPTYAKDSREISQIIRNLYKTSFEQYDARDYSASLQTIQLAKQRYPNNDIEDKFTLLEALLTSKTQSVGMYKQALESFIENYKTSTLVPYANSLLKACNELIASTPERINAIAHGNDTTTREKLSFMADSNKPHYFMAIVKQPLEKARDIQAKFASFNNSEFTDNKLDCSIITLSDSSFAIVVKEFRNKEQAMKYLGLSKTSQAPAAGLNESEAFVITNENYYVFTKTKAVSEYMEFFTKNYN